MGRPLVTTMVASLGCLAGLWMLSCKRPPLSRENQSQSASTPAGSLTLKSCRNAWYQERWDSGFFAPYADITVRGDRSSVGLFVFAFITATSTGEPGWGGMEAIDEFSGNEFNLGVIEEIKELRQKGGDVMVSIGGASGLSLAQFHSKNGKSASQLAAAYARVVDTLKLGIVDFDIEGKTLEDAGAMELHSSALVDLQKTHPELRIWYTLPVFPQGLTSKGIEAVRKTLEKKVRLSGVNIMAMDYNDELAPPKLKSMGAYAIDAANATHKQLSALFASFGKSFDWKNLGVTPMIGVNDVKSEVFYLSDAKMLTDFASERRLGMLSMWSLGRDRPSEAIGDVSPVHSGINAAAGSFSRIFSGYGAPIFKNQESGKRGGCE